jgi:hypothetical protein
MNRHDAVQAANCPSRPLRSVSVFFWARAARPSDLPKWTTCSRVREMMRRCQKYHREKPFAADDLHGVPAAGLASVALPLVAALLTAFLRQGRWRLLRCAAGVCWAATALLAAASVGFLGCAGSALGCWTVANCCHPASHGRSV